MSNLVWTLDVDSRRSESLAGSVPYLPCQVFWASQKALGFYVKVTESSPTFPKQSEIRKMPYEELSKRITYIFFTENFCCHCWLFFLFCFYSTKPNSDKIYYPRVCYGNKHLLWQHAEETWNDFVISKRTAAPWRFQAYTSFKQTSESCKISKPNGQKQHEFMKRSKIKLR